MLILADASVWIILVLSVILLKLNFDFKLEFETYFSLSFVVDCIGLNSDAGKIKYRFQLFMI